MRFELRKRLTDFRIKSAQYTVRSVLRSLVFYKIFNVHVHHRDRLPKAGPAIIIGNHTSYLDGFLLWGAQRNVSYMMFMIEMLRWPVVGSLMLAMGHVPVDRKGNGAGSQALKDAQTLLENGHVLTMFPAGNITKPQFKPGVALLARRTDAPIYPVGLIGARDVWPKGVKWPWQFKPRARVDIIVGMPLYPEDFESTESLLMAAEAAVYVLCE